ncbi:MAG: imidazoleglycerol-phosphate dehydratase HisB [Planctomycetota bacterium]
MGRSAEATRMTKETEVACRIDLDGSGRTDVSTGVGFLDHMLDLLGRHALLDLDVKAKGDTHVDPHHTVEDVGIVLGTVLSEALGDRKGIRRFGFASVPMDEALAQVSIDISGRGRAEVAGDVPEGAPLSPSLVEGFLAALAENGGLTLHAELRRGKDAHHAIEAVFKALARALRAAVEIDPREGGVPSTKGVL